MPDLEHSHDPSGGDGEYAEFGKMVEEEYERLRQQDPTEFYTRVNDLCTEVLAAAEEQKKNLHSTQLYRVVNCSG